MKKIIFLLLGLVLIYSCHKDNSEKAAVSFYLTDAPLLENYQSVNIHIQSVSYSLDGEMWTNLPFTPVNVDLLELSNGKDTLLSNITLEAGTKIQQIRLVLGNSNTITLASGVTVDLKTPSGQTSGLKINVQSTAEATSRYKVVIDFDAARSIVMQGNGSFLLKPVIRAYIQANTSAVSGNLLPADIKTRVFTVTAAGDTISTLSDVAQNNYFQLHGLFSGTYDIKAQNLTTLEIQTLKANLSITGGTDANLGTLNIP